MLLGWKNYCCENGCTTKSNLQILYIINSPVSFFTETEKNVKIYMEVQKILKNQNNPEKKRIIMEMQS